MVGLPSEVKADGVGKERGSTAEELLTEGTRVDKTVVVTVTKVTSIEPPEAVP